MTETPLCSHCGRPIRAGGAKGLDARCYQFQRRNGYLPHPEPREKWAEAALTVRMSSAMASMARAAAKTLDIPVAEWVRMAIKQALGGSK
jgi:hypothetical protein